MKKITLLLIAFFIIQTSKAQDSVTVEKSLIGVSASPFGALTFNYENKLAREWTLISSAGIYYDYDTKNNRYNSKGYFIGSSFGLEPRWYYNLDRRNKLSKNIKFNTGNYWSLGFNYSPKLVLATNQSYYEFENAVYLLPSYGIRRTIYKNIYFDGSLFTGYSYVFNNETFEESNSGSYSIRNGGYFHAGLKLRIGLNFIAKK